MANNVNCFLISTSDVGPNLFILGGANILKVVHLDHAASFHPLLSLVQCFPFSGGNRVLARFNTYFLDIPMCRYYLHARIR